MLEHSTTRVDLQQGMANPSFAHFVNYAGDSVTAMLVAGSASTLLERFSQQSSVALIPIDAPHVLGHSDAHIADRQDSASIAAAVALSGEIAAELASPVLQPIAAQLGEPLLESIGENGHVVLRVALKQIVELSAHGLQLEVALKHVIGTSTSLRSMARTLGRSGKTSPGNASAICIRAK